MAGPLGVTHVPSLVLDSLGSPVPFFPLCSVKEQSVSSVSLGSPKGPDAGFLSKVKGLDAVLSGPPALVSPACPPLVGSDILCCGSPRLGAKNFSSPASPAMSNEAKVSSNTFKKPSTVNGNSKSWAQVAVDKGSHSFASLKYFPPCVGSEFDSPLSPPDEVLQQSSELWGATLVGVFPGKHPHVAAVNSIARRVWARFGLRHIAVNEKGFYFFQFDSVSQLEDCLACGPWAFKKSPLFLKRL